MMLFLLCALGLILCTEAAYIDEIFSWKELAFNWPNDSVKSEAIKDGSYIPQNNLPVGLAIWKDKIFITVPRLKPGVASSLNYFTMGGDKSPLLKPYPSWDANLLHPGAGVEMSSFNSSVVSVFRIWTDKCDRLWVMDTGTNNILGKANQIAEPSLLIFDLNTDSLITRHYFNKSNVKPNSLFVNIVVDVNTDCADAFAYISDLGEYGLLVYSLKANRSWRVEHYFFHFDPTAGNYSVGELNFQWSDGIIGLALAKIQPDGHRKVYFHPLSSTKEFSVSNKILQNETRATSVNNYNDFKLVGDRGTKSQSSASFYDSGTGILFYTQVNKDALACWNTSKSLVKRHTAIVSRCNEVLQFPNDIKIDEKDVIWILSDRLPRFQYSTMDLNDTNYRILSIKIQDAINNTVCV